MLRGAGLCGESFLVINQHLQDQIRILSPRPQLQAHEASHQQYQTCCDQQLPTYIARSLLKSENTLETPTFFSFFFLCSLGVLRLSKIRPYRANKKQQQRIRMWKIIFKVSHIKSCLDKKNLIRRFDIVRGKYDLYVRIFAPRLDKYSV